MPAIWWCGLFRNTAFLLPRYGKAGEGHMIETGLPLEAQILQLGHHGSRTSSSLEFLLAVRPELRFIPQVWTIPSDILTRK